MKSQYIGDSCSRHILDSCDSLIHSMTVDEAGSSAQRKWLIEHRLRAVLEIRNGAPMGEVAERYGTSRQSVYD